MLIFSTNGQTESLKPLNRNLVLKHTLYGGPQWRTQSRNDLNKISLEFFVSYQMPKDKYLRAYMAGEDDLIPLEFTLSHTDLEERKISKFEYRAVYSPLGNLPPMPNFANLDFTCEASHIWLSSLKTEKIKTISLKTAPGGNLNISFTALGRRYDIETSTTNDFEYSVDETVPCAIEIAIDEPTTYYPKKSIADLVEEVREYVIFHFEDGDKYRVEAAPKTTKKSFSAMATLLKK